MNNDKDINDLIDFSYQNAGRPVTMKEMKDMKEGQLRVWWIPQVPGKSFYVYVKDKEQAKFLLDVLAKYDSFQFNENIKPDYSNVGGLQILDDDNEWVDWNCEICGDDIDECVCEEDKNGNK